MYDITVPKDQDLPSTVEAAGELILNMIKNSPWAQREKPSKGVGEVAFKLAGFTNVQHAGVLSGLGAAYTTLTGLEPPSEYMPDGNVF